MTSESYHEPYELLTDQTRNMHRAIVSLMEELEAIDWYQQRAECTTDQALREVLEHNRDEEIEHAMMVLEWIRRNNPTFNANIGTYLNTTAPITEVESEETEGNGASNGPTEVTSQSTKLPAGAEKADGSLGIGSLRRSAR